ncbi:MAG: hypothetical protein KME04_04280 [Pleurocapsa minor GSE-CHR-MK-17-07R]|jgi:hypothetical protein|nr:hypothetical protein [Pleurocapsa minor GSE-CHR-MK 17-07R]
MQGVIIRSEAWFRRLLWGLVCYNIVVCLITLIDFIQHPTAFSPYNAFNGSPIYRWFVVLLAGPATMLIGGLILRRTKGNVIGLLMIIWGGGLFGFGMSVEIDPLWYSLSSLMIGVTWAALILMPLLFPNGKSFPAWLMPILFANMLTPSVLGVITVFSAFEVPNLAGVPLNPLYIAGLAEIRSTLSAFWTVIFLPLIPGVLVSPVMRYRRATLHERQQLKWFVWWSAILFVPYLLFYLWAVTQYADIADAPPIVATIGNALVGVIGLFPPIAIGYSILRHRLYDIDIIIRRTLIYAVLTGILAIVYFGAIILTQQLLRAATGETPDIAIVLSTLLIAALFSPIRRRVQDVIDRRLYRRKYDMEKTLAGFQQTLRDEVDMETLKSNLVGVVSETMQPNKIALWVKE